MSSECIEKPTEAATFDEALMRFVALRSNGMDPVLAAVVADAMGSAFALGAAWAAQHGVKVVHDAIEAQLAHADVVASAMEALVRVHARALDYPDSTAVPMH